MVLTSTCWSESNGPFGLPGISVFCSASSAAAFAALRSAGATGVIQTMDAQGGAGVGDGGKPKAEGDGPRDIFALAGMRAPAKK